MSEAPWVLRTERLVLRAPEPGDVAAAVTIHCDPDANLHRPGGVRDETAVRRDFAMWRAEWRDAGLSYWVIEDAGGAVGFGGLRHQDENGEAVLNLYYRLRPSVWGNGYATEMGAAAIAYAARELPQTPLSLVTTPDNGPSRRVAARLGFTEVRRRDRDGVREIVHRLAR